MYNTVFGANDSKVKRQIGVPLRSTEYLQTLPWSSLETKHETRPPHMIRYDFGLRLGYLTNTQIANAHRVATLEYPRNPRTSTRRPLPADKPHHTTTAVCESEGRHANRFTRSGMLAYDALANNSAPFLAETPNNHESATGCPSLPLFTTIAQTRRKMCVGRWSSTAWCTEKSERTHSLFR